MRERILLNSKIHRAKITEANKNYIGSISICPELMIAANIIQWEQVHVWNIDTGKRLITYAIYGENQEICLNGSAVHNNNINDRIIIASFISTNNENHQPKVVLVDETNRIIR